MSQHWPTGSYKTCAWFKSIAGVWWIRGRLVISSEDACRLNRLVRKSCLVIGMNLKMLQAGKKRIFTGKKKRIDLMRRVGIILTFPLWWYVTLSTRLTRTQIGVVFNSHILNALAGWGSTLSQREVQLHVSHMKRKCVERRDCTIYFILSKTFSWHFWASLTSGAQQIYFPIHIQTVCTDSLAIEEVLLTKRSKSSFLFLNQKRLRLTAMTRTPTQLFTDRLLSENASLDLLIICTLIYLKKIF